MFARGEFTTDNVTYGTMVSHTKTSMEILLVTSGTVVSAYKSDMTGSYSYNNNRAKELSKILQTGIKGCTSKNGVPTPFVGLGAVSQHDFTKSNVQYIMQMFRGEMVGAYVQASDKRVELQYADNLNFPNNIPYVKLTEIKKELSITDDELDTVPVRSVQEIALEKDDISWLKSKQYYIVNNDEDAEKIFAFLENYNGPIAYDTETTGLRMNCFGKIGSSYKATLDKYNSERPKEEQIRADRLVGIIFCVEENISYYFPCFNRKFKNLYEDKDSPYRKQIITNTKARYTLGTDLTYPRGDMYSYIMNTPDDEITCDVILMERVRNILEKKHLVAHNGTFEWKVGWQYEIDTNIKDDTILMHQIMYKFRSTTSNRGEPSNLKYLAKRELGIDQWELSDFFPNLKEDKTGMIRNKAKGKSKKAESRIDFSYMDYDGTRVYAPTDGDVTLCLFHKYKEDMVRNHSELEYLYNVELIVSLAIAYMEFYGHRVDESKIFNAREQTRANIVTIESKIRQMINYSNEKELELFDKLQDVMKQLDKVEDKEQSDLLAQQRSQLVEELEKAIADNTENVLNLASSQQVCDLFYNKLQIPFKGDKQSVAKNQVKALLKETNDDGTLKYPVVKLYSEYKNEDTLMTKFFDALPYFMYPGGFIFSSYGQISTATGRMSCSKPNAQQYPKVITKIVAPRPGYVMLDADYSQIEYRVLTAMAGNEFLAELFADPDSDYHTLMASLMYDVPYSAVTASMRSAAKSFNFGIPYGMGFGSLAILLTGKKTAEAIDEAKEKYEMYFKNQPKTRKFFDNVKEMAQVNGYTKTLFNRYRYYSFIDKDGNVNQGKKAAALRQAGNAIIQGTAADIFKISVARNFSFIRRERLLGDFLIINMVHDEQLMEINAEKLNVQRVLAEVGHNMQYSIQGFPPLYVGAGLGVTWGYAKGKMAEIHPLLLQQFTQEALSIPLRKETPSTEDCTKEVLDYFSSRVLEFRRNKVAEYLSNQENWHQVMHPAIASLINLQFNYGRGDDAKAYIGPNGEKYSDQEFLELNIADFIKENNLPVDAKWFNASEVKDDIEEDSEYSDDEEENDIDDLLIEGNEEKVFQLVNESDKLFGSSVHDMISVFGSCLLIQQKICGIDTRDMHFRQIDKVLDYLMQYVCEDGEEELNESLQIVFLTAANVLKYTGIYVSGINQEEMQTQIKKIRMGAV